MRSSVLPSLGISILAASYWLFAPVPTFASHPSASEGLEITDTYVKSPFDKVPRFCNPPNISAASLVASVASGNWSDPATWSNGEVPGADAKVRISDGMTVTYDAESDARLDCIEIQGQLVWALNTNTRMYVNEILVMPSGGMTIGTETNPLPAQFTAEIIYNDSPLKVGTLESPGIDPQMYGKGLITFGDVTMHGRTLDPTFVRLDRETKAGDTALDVAQVPTGWRAGDEIVLPDTRTIRQGYRNDSQRELLSIASVTGTTLTLTTPLKYDHRCARDANEEQSITALSSGEPLCGHVGNLSRNIRFRSENPSSIRGHTLFLHRSAVNVRYVAFNGMGRTKNEDIDNSTFDAQGKVTKIGSNQIGRYPFHMHHVWGPRNPSNTGYQAYIVGNVIDGGLKWLMTLHGTHYGLVSQNVVHDGYGAGIATEDGSESYNLIEKNFVVGMGGMPRTVLGSSNIPASFQGTEGDGFWSAGANNSYRENIVADVTTNYPDSGTPKTHGFAVWGTVSLNIGDANGQVLVPKIRGANMRDPAETEKKQINGEDNPSTAGFIEFSNNEVYGGAFLGLAMPRTGRSLIQDFRTWNVRDIGIRAYDTGMQIVDYVARGEGYGTGIWEHNASSNISNANIQGMAVGIESNCHHFFVHNSYLRNSTNLLFLNDVCGGLPWRMGVTSNVILESPPSSIFPQPYTAIRSTNTNPADQFVLYAYNGDPNKSYQIYTESTAPCEYIDCDAARTLARTLQVDGLVAPVVFSAPPSADTLIPPAKAETIRVVAQFPQPGAQIASSNVTAGYTLVGLNGNHYNTKIHGAIDDQVLVSSAVGERDVSTNQLHVFEDVVPGPAVVELWAVHHSGPVREFANTRLQIPVTVSDQADPNQPPAADPPPTSSTPTTGINHVPSITLPDNQSPFSVRIGQTLTVPITATDPDGDEITISIPNLSALLPGAILE